MPLTQLIGQQLQVFASVLQHFVGNQLEHWKVLAMNACIGDILQLTPDLLLFCLIPYCTCIAAINAFQVLNLMYFMQHIESPDWLSTNNGKSFRASFAGVIVLSKHTSCHHNLISEPRSWQSDDWKQGALCAAYLSAEIG